MPKKVRVPNKPIAYPTWRFSGRPTPSEMVMICDSCAKAEWTNKAVNEVRHCYSGHRMREATPAEYNIARSALTKETQLDY